MESPPGLMEPSGIAVTSEDKEVVVKKVQALYDEGYNPELGFIHRRIKEDSHDVHFTKCFVKRVCEVCEEEGELRIEDGGELWIFPEGCEIHEDVDEDLVTEFAERFNSKEMEWRVDDQIASLHDLAEHVGKHCRATFPALETMKQGHVFRILEVLERRQMIEAMVPCLASAVQKIYLPTGVGMSEEGLEVESHEDADSSDNSWDKSTEAPGRSHRSLSGPSSSHAEGDAETAQRQSETGDKGELLRADNGQQEGATITSADEETLRIAVKSLCDDAIHPDELFGVLARRIKEGPKVEEERWNKEFLRKVTIQVCEGKTLVLPDGYIPPEGEEVSGDLKNQVADLIKGGEITWEKDSDQMTCAYELAKHLKEEVLFLEKYRLGAIYRLVKDLEKREKVIEYKKVPNSTGKGKPKSILVPSEKHKKLQKLHPKTEEEWSKMERNVRTVLQDTNKGLGIPLCKFKKVYEDQFKPGLHCEEYGYNTLLELLKNRSLASIVKRGRTDWALPFRPDSKPVDSGPQPNY